MPYYVRMQGKVFGPLEMDRLKELALSGKLSRIHEISEDQMNWKVASKFTEVFESKNERATAAKATAIQRKTGANSENNNDGGEQSIDGTGSSRPPGTKQVSEWHYAVDGAELGPVTLSDLQSLIRHRSLKRDDLVWKTSMAQWAPAKHIPELVSLFSSPTGFGDRSTKSKLTAVLLALFLGSLGIHHFYLGNTVRGIVVVVLFFLTLGIVSSIVALIEAIVMACTSDESFERKWCYLGNEFSR
jgi:TM2 domain-containing membrane protein YozV